MQVFTQHQTMKLNLVSALLVFILTIVSVDGDIPRCDRRNPNFTHSPFCLPNDYNKDIVPPTEGPLNINVDIWVFEVSRIDDIQLSMTFELYFDLTWNESRLVINETSPDWGPDGSFMGSTNFVKSLWLPDIQILNLKQFQKRQIVTDVAGLIIFKTRSILYTVSTEAIISCPMKFSAYPLDHQECKFNVGSYIHDATQIAFTGTFGHDVVNQRAQQYEINITALRKEDTMLLWANRNYSLTGFKINLIRRRTPVLLQTYLPSGLFVVVSWISFIVPPEVVPGRMALLVTLFLVLVNIFNSVTANAPKSEGLTAVETWVVMCILHVFCVLSEYAIILKIIQLDKQETKRINQLNARASLQQSSTPSPTLTHLGDKSGFCSKLKCCCSNCFGAKSKTLDNGNGDAGNGIKLQRRFKHNDASCSNVFEQVFETNPTYVNREHASLISRSCSQEYLDHRAQQQQQQHHQPFIRSDTTQQGQQPLLPNRIIPIQQYAFPPSPRPPLPPQQHIQQQQQGSPARPTMCSVGTGSRHHSHKRRHPQSTVATTTTTHDVAVGKDLESDTSKPESSWAKLELCTSVTNLSSKHQAAAESRNERLLSRYERIDKVAMWLFPIIFFLFNVCYWSYYLLLDDVLQDLW